ncbi:MAG: hypothetical protein ACK5YR_03155 [Pirellula sp.]|jgi:hypothetical protein
MKVIRPAALSLLLTSLACSFASTVRSQESSSQVAENLLSVSPTTDASDFLRSHTLSKRTSKYIRRRTPAMIGDFYAGSPLILSGDSRLDRLFVYANDLDVPNVLPSGSSLLSLSEPGPIGIYSSSLTSTQDIQTLLRSSQPLPPSSLVGVINDNAILTSVQSISQIQNTLASTSAAFDIIPIAPPPGSYDAAVNSAFQARNGSQGSMMFNSSASGAILQGGVDTLNGGEDADAFYFYDYVVRFNTAMADATSGGVGRMKIAEGGTVLPQDRIFFRYNYLTGVRYGNSRSELNRIVTGFERAMLDGLFSLELRAPFATDATTSASIDNSAVSNGEHTRFGNLTVNLKSLLLEREHFALSGGLGIGLPSASDVMVNFADGSPLLRVANESVRLQPFLGSLITPNDKWFIQSFLQLDTAANGNTVSINPNGAGLVEAGRLTDSTNLFLDVGMGYWLYRSDSQSGLTGVVPMLELHHNIALQAPDVLTSGPYQVTNDNSETSLTNFVIGNTLEFSQRANLTTAYTTPIGGSASRQYNGGLQVFLSSGW